MSEIRIMKRGKVYQYRFEIASQGGVRRYINKNGFESEKEDQELISNSCLSCLSKFCQI